MTKEKIESYLYNYDYHQGEIDRMEMAILEIVEKKQHEYEKYPQLSLDKIRVKSSNQNSLINSVIKIIDKYDRQIRCIKASMDDKFKDFNRVKAAVGKLNKIEFALVVAKYFQRLRGEKLYEELNYSERGYYDAQKRVLRKLVRLV